VAATSERVFLTPMSRERKSSTCKVAVSRHTLIILMVLALSCVAAPPNAHPAPQAKDPKTKVESSEPKAQRPFKRLILKDGSYEAISKYEVKGKLVRYFSSERHEWEEVPFSLVDWAATEKYAEESASERQVRRTQSAESDARDLAEEEAKSPWVTPRLRLPENGGVFLLDRFEGRPELNQLRQNGANVNKNTGGNILRGVINPIASTKQTIELSGLNARMQSHVADPTIYVALDSGGDPSAAYTPETAKDHFRIVRCEEKKDKRVVGVINIAIYGKVSQNAAYIETNVEPLAGNWVKIRPAKALPPGEYALVELLGKQGINTAVWDFGVNPSAPSNANVRKEDPIPDSQAPVLQKREKRESP
jgi:hypothetical protein